MLGLILNEKKVADEIITNNNMIEAPYNCINILIKYYYLKDNKPFVTYYMTVSGHLQYTYIGNSMATKNRKYVKDLPYSEAIKAYLSTQIEMLKKSKYRHWHCTPIIWETEIDNAVFIKAFRIAFKLRTGVSVLIGTSLLNAIVVDF